MGNLGTWAYEQTQACKDSESQAPAFIRSARDSEDVKRNKKFSLKDLWVESVLLLVAGE
jgi:hypothetical protein